MSTTQSLNTTLLDAMQWRYATKKMNGTPVPAEKLERILDAISLAPSGMGIQPFSVLVISDPELKKQMLPVANNQAQMTDSSHVLVFAAWDTVTEERAAEFLQLNISTRNVTMESLERYRMVLDHMVAREAEGNFNWAARQAYIAFGVAIAAAASEQVDATPMEGFKNEELDKLLGLEKLGLRSLALLPLGYRDAANDWLAPLTKVRREKEKLFIRL